MIIKGYIPLLFSKEVSTTQPQSLATNKMNEIRRKARENDVQRTCDIKSTNGSTRFACQVLFFPHTKLPHLPRAK